MIKKMTLLPIKKSLLLISLSVFLSGCASFGKGVAEAFLEKSDAEDTRACQIRGKSFEGIAPGLEKSQGKTKVLMVHGVGDRLPGYSTEFLEKLANELHLTAKSSSYKDIKLMSFSDPEEKLGDLRISRLQDENGNKELWFYELTWSEITREQKALLAFDNSGEYSFKRAEVNDMLKKFSNDTGPDPIIYLGKSRDLILRSFAQAFCWMGKDSWDQIPKDGRQGCDFTNVPGASFNQDEFVFISHSLGSRIAIDGITRMVSLLESPEKKSTIRTINKVKREALQKKHVQIFMMSNQLPMLQLGRELPEVSAQKADYCQVTGSKYTSRMFNETSIIAFSDPNDLLSYAIPQDFSEKYLDSRLCINVTNVNINVAKVFDAFGMGKMANPIEAHVGYSKDDRVVALIARGIGGGHTAPLVKEKCQWTEINDQ
ncbi:hypothetical protein [Methylobacter psychrophilus]|uniref:hypothetical protein n=1 Tax=Methylobacter psychrophilus TaxID=96941 RepID=UPI0021D49F34|nr:hypothetical protein [Methylobacter psychrophilus]